MSDEGLTAVSCFHVKGGCGKTTVLSSLGVYVAYATGLKVAAVDMDIQGALYSTFLGLESAKRYAPSQRDEYYKQFMQGFQSAKTKYDQVNQKLQVAHYPLELFTEDKFFRPEHVSGFSQRMSEIRDDVSLLLLDLPPGRLSSNDVRPFSAIDDVVKNYVFLIPSRPLIKEVYDGLANYKFAKEMLVAEGVSNEKVRGILAINFNSEKRSREERLFFESISSYHKRHERAGFSIEEISYAIPNNFTDIELSLDTNNISRISIPQVLRTKEDMQHYCIMLDGFFDLPFVQEEMFR